MNERKRKTIELCADLFCCVLLGAVICAVWFGSFSLNTGIWACLALAAADLALLLLFSRRWWLLPVFVAVAVVLAVFIALLSDQSDALWQFARGFFSWCAQGFPPYEPYATPACGIAVRLAAALPVCALLLLFYRRIFAFAVLPPVALALLWVARSSAFFIPALLLLLAALIISLAKATGRRINKQLPEQDRVTNALLELFAIVLMPLALAFALVCAPKADGDWRSPQFVYLIEDFGEALDATKSPNSTIRAFDIGKTGFSPLGGRLGGNISPDNTLALKVTTSVPLRLAGATFDTYTGSHWVNARALRGYRFSSPLWTTLRRQAFALNKPDGGKEARELFGKMTEDVTLDITCDTPGSVLFHAGMVQSLGYSNFDPLNLYFDEQGDLFTKNSWKSQHYTLHTTVIRRNLPDFHRNMRALETLCESAADKDWDDVHSVYLQLPETLPQSVREAAHSITAGCQTPYDKALALERWLNKTCAYTLSPGNPPENEDFVAAFLTSRQGYCVYYASALTVLARCAGLPARYVTGFSLKKNPSIDSPQHYVATNATAHAWTEIYFRGIGWLTFDAAGWNFDETAVVTTLDDAPDAPSGSIPQQANDSSGKEPAISGTNGDVRALPPGVIAAFIGLLALLIALCVFVATRFLRLSADSTSVYRRLCRRVSDPCTRLDVCYRQIVRQAAFWGIALQADDTIATFVRHLDACLGRGEALAVGESLMRSRFALIEPSEDDVLRACAFSAALEERLRKELGLLRYLWRRVLLGR